MITKEEINAIVSIKKSVKEIYNAVSFFDSEELLELAKEERFTATLIADSFADFIVNIWDCDFVIDRKIIKNPLMSSMQFFASEVGLSWESEFACDEVLKKFPELFNDEVNMWKEIKELSKEATEYQFN